MFVFTQQNTIANQFLVELRDRQIQKDSWRFRKNLERLGELFAYEISKTLNYHEIATETVLGSKNTHVLTQQPVLATILRAGLPLYQGFLNIFDKAESAFIGAYRGEHTEDDSFDIVQGYTVTPSLDGKVLILIDPMLATGKSMLAVYESLLFYGKPTHTHIVACIASKAGVEFIEKHIPQASIWVGDTDAELNVKSYIVPGLGDAGDLAFGNKQS
jgi:uracil phosphoribosyltransferase